MDAADEGGGMGDDMAAPKTQLEEIIAEDIRQMKGIMVPVKAGLHERQFVRKARCSSLHPNPDDEFCMPNIGPNYEIISRYVQMIVRFDGFQPSGKDDPIIVEKVSPSGYMILNGHHRWAAAMRTGFDPVPIQIVNLPQEKDIYQMIENSSCDRRVTMDLEEVVFCMSEEDPAEQTSRNPLDLLGSIRHPEKIRLGVPALLNYLRKQKIDAWVYSGKNYSYDDVNAYFERYSLRVDGIITGTARKTADREDAMKRTQKKFADHYKETIHIDRHMVLRTLTGSREFEEHPITAGPSEWSAAVIDILNGMK